MKTSNALLIASLFWLSSLVIILGTACQNADRNSSDSSSANTEISAEANETPDIAEPATSGETENENPLEPTTDSNHKPTASKPEIATPGNKTPSASASPKPKSAVPKQINASTKPEKPTVNQPAAAPQEEPKPQPATKITETQAPEPQVTAEPPKPQPAPTTPKATAEQPKPEPKPNPEPTPAPTTSNPDWPVPAKYLQMKNPVPADATSIKNGKALYSKHCASCHGKTGLGDGPKAAQLDTHSGDFSSKEFQNQTDGALFYKTLEGRDEMPGYKKKIPDEEDIWHLVNYMRSLK